MNHLVSVAQCSLPNLMGVDHMFHQTTSLLPLLPSPSPPPQASESSKQLEVFKITVNE